MADQRTERERLEGLYREGETMARTERSGLPRVCLLLGPSEHDWVYMSPSDVSDAAALLTERTEPDELTLRAENAEAALAAVREAIDGYPATERTGEREPWAYTSESAVREMEKHGGTVASLGSRSSVFCVPLYRGPPAPEPERGEGARCTKCGNLASKHPVDIDGPGAGQQVYCPSPVLAASPEPAEGREPQAWRDLLALRPKAHAHLSLQESYATLARVFKEVGEAHVLISRSELPVSGMSIVERVRSLIEVATAPAPAGEDAVRAAAQAAWTAFVSEYPEVAEDEDCTDPLDIAMQSLAAALESTAPAPAGERDPRDCFPTHGLHGGPLVRIVAYYEDGSERAVSHQGHRHEKRFRGTHWQPAPHDATGEEVGDG